MIKGQKLGLTRDPALERELEHLHKRVNEVFSKGDIDLDRTITPEGETGAKTINKVAGTVNMAAAATSLVVTNSLVNKNSFVFLTLRTNDASAVIRGAVPGDGFFTIHMSAAPTGEVSIAFLVTN